MKTLTAAAFVLATALVIAPAARANSINFSTVGATGSQQAALSPSFIVSGGVVTAATGTVTFSPNTPGAVTETITGLATGETFAQQFSESGTGNNGSYDQEVSLTSPYLDNQGLALTLADGDELQIWVFPATGSPILRVADEDDLGDYDSYHEPISELQVFTPEPSTLFLFGTGLLGLAGLVRRKFMQSR